MGITKRNDAECVPFSGWLTYSDVVTEYAEYSSIVARRYGKQFCSTLFIIMSYEIKCILDVYHFIAMFSQLVFKIVW